MPDGSSLLFSVCCISYDMGYEPFHNTVFEICETELPFSEIKFYSG